MANGAELITGLLNVNHCTMVQMAEKLDTLTQTELHNLISKTNVVRALTSMALQDKKFPIPK